MEAFGAPAATAPAAMPADLAEAAVPARPLLTRGGEPRAGVLLLEIEVQGLAEG